MPYALHFSLEGDGDSVSLARSISKDSLASNVMNITPKHMLGTGPPHLPPRRLNGQGLLGHVRIEDEEEEVEEEELVAIIHPAALGRHRAESDMEQDELEIQKITPTTRTRLSPRPDLDPAFCVPDPQPQAESFFLEPLMPAILKPAKEKSISLNKEEERGESRSRAAVGPRKATVDTQKTESSDLKSHFTPIPTTERVTSPLRPPTEGAVGSSPQSGREQSCSFFLHLSGEPEEQGQAGLPGQAHHSPSSTAWEVGHDSDSEIADLEEEEEEEQMELAKEVLRRVRGKCIGEGGDYDFVEGEGESDKLREDEKVCERDDKEGGSGRSSPCPSTMSWASSCSASGSTSVRMTSFAERKLHKLNFPDGCSSTSSSQKTTPDGSESAPYLLGGSWRLKRDGSPCPLGKELGPGLGKEGVVGTPVVPSDLVQLHMQLEEQRRAIEHQKKKIETLSARQRLKLGKAAFLNIVKKGGGGGGEGKSDTLPLPLKHRQETPELSVANRGKVKTLPCKDDSCLESLRGQRKAGQTEGGQTYNDNRFDTNPMSQDAGAEPDLSECSRSIELLNKAISSIQQQMMQLSLQQDLLMKQSVVSPPGPPGVGSATASPISAPTSAPYSDSRTRAAVHFVEIGSSNSASTCRPPKLSSGRRSPQTKPSELKLIKENYRPVSTKNSSPTSDSRPSPRGSISGDQEGGSFAESTKSSERNILRNTTFRVHDDSNPRSPREGPGRSTDQPLPLPQEPPVILSIVKPLSGAADGKECTGSGKEAAGGEDATRIKGQLIEVDLSDLKDLSEDGGSDQPDTGEQKNALGFFFKVLLCMCV